MQYGRDAHFDDHDHDHQFYDVQEDRRELVNLAMDRSRQSDIRSGFTELRTIEHGTDAHGF